VPERFRQKTQLAAPTQDVTAKKSLQRFGKQLKPLIQPQESIPTGGMGSSDQLGHQTEFATEVERGGLAVRKAIGPDFHLKSGLAARVDGTAETISRLEHRDVRRRCCLLQTVGQAQA
jgi:hypothetical protein